MTTPPEGLSEQDKARLLEFYETHLRVYGHADGRGMGWLSTAVAEKRFEVLVDTAADTGGLHGKSVLDVGCGTGALYEYLVRHGVQTTFTGVDLNPEAVAIAQTKYPHATWITADFSVFPETEFNYVLSSGAMTINVHKAKERYFGWIEKMHRMATLGVAFNMLNARYHAGDATYVAYDPAEVVAFCKTLSPQVELLQGYLPQDFTVYIRK